MYDATRERGEAASRVSQVPLNINKAKYESSLPRQARTQEGQATPVKKLRRGRPPLSRLVSSRLSFHRSSSVFWAAYTRSFHAPFFYRLSEWPLSLVDPILLQQTYHTRSTLNPSRKPGIDNNQETVQMHVPLHIISTFFLPLTGLPVVIFYFLSYYGLYLNGGSESRRNITKFIHIY